MEQKRNHSHTRPCKKADRLAKELCAAVNFEERRREKPTVRAEVRALYEAEAQSYYFYFEKVSSRA